MKTIILSFITVFFFSCKNEGNEEIRISYFDGDSIVRQIISFDGAQQNGIYISYYPNGNIKRVENYAGGAKEGIGYYFHRNGRLESTSNYVNGEKDGKSIGYYQSGNKRYEVEFIEGTPTGNSIEYHDTVCSPKVILSHDENGKIIKRQSLLK